MVCCVRELSDTLIYIYIYICCDYIWCFYGAWVRAVVCCARELSDALAALDENAVLKHEGWSLRDTVRCAISLSVFSVLPF